MSFRLSFFYQLYLWHLLITLWLSYLFLYFLIIRNLWQLQSRQSRVKCDDLLWILNVIWYMFRSTCFCIWWWSTIKYNRLLLILKVRNFLLNKLRGLSSNCWQGQLIIDMTQIQIILQDCKKLDVKLFAFDFKILTNAQKIILVKWVQWYALKIHSHFLQHCDMWQNFWSNFTNQKLSKKPPQKI